MKDAKMRQRESRQKDGNDALQDQVRLGGVNSFLCPGGEAAFKAECQESRVYRG